MKLKIFNSVYFIGLILTFFIMFVIFIIPNTYGYVYVGIIFWLLTFGLCFYNNPKKYYQFIKCIFRLKIVKILMIFLFYILLTSIIHLCLGYYKAPILHYIPRVYNLVIATVIVYLFPISAIYLKIPLKKIIKTIILTIYGVLLIGIIQFFTIMYNIKIVNNILDFFTNARQVLYSTTIGYTSLNRINSLFNEPGVVGKFIFVMMPIIIKFCFSPYCILKNKLLNLLIKKSFVVVMFTTLFMSKSPIWIIFCLIEFIVLLIIQIFHIIKKYKMGLYFIFLMILPIIFISVFNVHQADNIDKESFLYRIAATLNNFNSLEGLIINEPSLANRIVSIIIQLKIFAGNIFFGVGYPNAMCAAKSVVIGAQFPLTKELIRFFILSNPGIAAINLSIVFTLLAETGLIGLGLYFYFVIYNIRFLNRLLISLDGLSQIFAMGLKGSLISLLIVSFYTSYLHTTMVWLLFGLSLIYIYAHNYYKQYISENFENNKEEKIYD